MKTSIFLPIAAFVLALVTSVASATWWVTHVITESATTLELGLSRVAHDMGTVWLNKDQSVFVSQTELELERNGVTVTLPTVSSIKSETAIVTD
jgi:hypothetical protein